MIITHKEFPDYRKFEIEYEGRPLKMEVGKMAELCNAAVLVTYGETTVLVTCTASARPKDGIDYFPLSVDFNEKLYAVGRIPGSSAQQFPNAPRAHARSARAQRNGKARGQRGQ